MVDDLVGKHGVQANGASNDEAEVEEMIGCVPGEHLVLVVVAQVVVEAKNGATMQKVYGGRCVTLFEDPGEGGEVDGMDLGLLPGTTHGRRAILGHEESLEDVSLRQGIISIDGGRDVCEIKRTRVVLLAMTSSALECDGSEIIVIAVET
jgi:hypothetical protein